MLSDISVDILTEYQSIYLVKKALQAAGLSADNVRSWEMSGKWIFGWETKFQGQMWNFEDSQPRTLSADDIPASQKGVYFFYNPLINFHIAQKPFVKKASVDLMANVRDWRKQVHLIGLIHLFSL